MIYETLIFKGINILNGHSERVKEYALIIAERIGSSKNNELKDFELACYLHDIGKIWISEDILNKSGKLTEEEYNVIKRHPLYSEELVHSIKESSLVRNIVLDHHERCDGSGYPNGITYKDIHILTKILSVADSFDAMVNLRPYRKRFPIYIAFEELKRCSNQNFCKENLINYGLKGYNENLFDPSIVNIFHKYYLEGQISIKY